MVICDIDYFKQYNDYFGHLEGDRCLIRVSALLKSALKRHSDLVCRYGGEEFAMILPGLGPKEAPALLQSILETVRTAQIPHPYGIASFLSLSMGVSFCAQSPEQSLDQVLLRADQALYQAKQKGRNQLCLDL